MAQNRYAGVNAQRIPNLVAFPAPSTTTIMWRLRLASKTFGNVYQT
jgi:hypothetical protein